MAPTNPRTVIALIASLSLAPACDEQQTGGAPEPIEFSYQVPRAIDDGWATGSLAEVGIAEAPVIAAFERILEGERYPNIHGVVIVRHGILVLEQYYSGRTSSGQRVEFERGTKHEVQSASKSVRSLLTGIAIDQGLLEGVDQPVSELFPRDLDPDAPEAARKHAITLEHVLTMSTGLEWHENDVPFGDPGNDLSHMYSLAPSAWSGYVLSRPMAADPGAEFLYNTGSSLLLNDLHSMIAGKRGDHWADEVLYSRIDSRPVADSWPPLATGLIPRDMAKIGQIMLDGGMWKDTRIVSADWVSASIEPAFQFDDRRGYGYQWWSRTFQTTGGEIASFHASGNGGQFIFVFPALDMVIVFTGGNYGSPLMNRPLELVEDYFLPAAL